MKFKVEPKDFMLFVIYCLLLLYLCAIAVLNISSLSADGTFYGLLPFKAFTPDYIGATLILFIIAIVAIFSTVSSYIFKREKGEVGIGITLKKKSSDGYSSWAKEKDIKEQSNVECVHPTDEVVNAAGIPLINDGKNIWVDNGEYHNLVIGSTGSGKTQTIVKPMVNLLAKKGESMIITDPKGEIYKYSASYLKEKGYRIIVLNFREPQRGNSWNPLALPNNYYRAGNQDKAIELLNDIALNIIYDPSNKNESDFWEKASAAYFSALALGLFKDAKEEEVNLNSINVMSTVGEERYATGNYIKEYFGMKGEGSTEYLSASAVINAPNDTKGGLLATFRQKIQLFTTVPVLSEMLSYSDFDMKSIGNGKTAVFMIIHDEKKTYHSLMTIFIKQCYETLIDVAQENGGKLPIRTNFILDEFANMPPLKDVDAMVSAARSRDIRFTFIIQNFAQLNDVYGDNVAEIIKGNCGNLVYLISTEMKALEEISKMCGEVKVTDEKDKNATRPLITITDLQKMKLFEAIIVRLRTSPFRTKLEPDFKMEWGIERKEEEYPTRIKHEVEIFDLKKFVIDERSKKMAQNGEIHDNNPFKPMDFGMPSYNPFGMPSANSGFKPNPSGLSSMDIDSMLKDLDEKFKELDRQEEEQKKKNMETKSDDKLLSITDAAKEDPMINIKEEAKEENPKINVDSDSKVIADNVVSDDEFFDDFFEDSDE